MKFIDPSGLCSKDSSNSYYDDDNHDTLVFSGACSGQEISPGAQQVNVTGSPWDVDPDLFRDPRFNSYPNAGTQVEQQRELATSVLRNTSVLARPLCSGGFFTYVGGTVTPKGSPLKADIYVFPVSYDSQTGFSSGVLGELGGVINRTKSLINVGAEGNVSWSGKVSAGGYAFFNSYHSVKFDGVEAGFLLDGEGNFGIYGGAGWGGGFYGKPSFGGCGSGR